MGVLHTKNFNIMQIKMPINWVLVYFPYYRDMQKLRDTLRKQSQGNGAPQGPLVFHTFYAEYRGDTPEQLVATLHKDSQSGTGMDYAAWWAWQKKLWSYTGGYTVPSPGEPDACAKLIDILTNVGALEPGPRPKPLVIPDKRLT